MLQTLRTYPLMMTWSWSSSRPWMVMLAAIQVLLPVAFVIGVSFWYPDVTPSIARNLITGTPTLILLTMGMDLVPQMVAHARLQGTYDFIRSLPVPRMLLLFADISMFFLLTLPGIIIALVLGSVYHHFTLQVSPLMIPVFILISMTGSFIGYAIALVVPRPRMAISASQFLLFFIVFFSPVIYPASQLPGWLEALHKVLPIQYMAELSRGTLSNADGNLGQAFAVSGAWCAVAALLCYLVMKKRS